MNVIFRYITFTIILTVIWSCGKDDLIQSIFDDESISTVGGTWKVISYDDFTNGIQIFKDSTNTWDHFNNGDVTVTFEDIIPTGHLNGVNVTNHVSGAYFLSHPRKITIELHITTFAAQPEWANLFSENITKAEMYSVNQTQLRIFYNDEKNSITFEKE